MANSLVKAKEKTLTTVDQLPILHGSNICNSQLTKCKLNINIDSNNKKSVRVKVIKLNKKYKKLQKQMMKMKGELARLKNNKNEELNKELNEELNEELN